ncbi:helix-turn-helix domain-containing protein [Celeribacter halophilus]|uniref:helix-turn-helix domain-containing protein n=1 Tax=Celeribacter halophilus TaxID=576117 RepID=UPI003A941894
MGRDKRNEARQPQFAKWIKAHRMLPAWKALTFPARDAYFHLAVRCMAETAVKNGKVRNNNGEVFRSLRDLAEDMGCTVKTAGAALADLQAKGWIVCTNPWVRGVDGKGKAAHFRLTMMPTEKRPPTAEPKHWEPAHDYPVTVYRGYLPKPRNQRTANLSRKQNPPPDSGTVVYPNGAQLRVAK